MSRGDFSWMLGRGVLLEPAQVRADVTASAADGVTGHTLLVGEQPTAGGDVALTTCSQRLSPKGSRYGVR